MANERITENFFRNHVLGDGFYQNEKLIFEEQSPSNLKIKKLLTNASKSGKGQGFPEFIVQYKENPEVIIVVECKAEPKYHESEKKDNPKSYAVDGALLYSSFLSKEFDVISIAISGETERELKITHYLQLKNTNEAHHIFKDDKFLSFSDYLDGYKTDERKFNQDFQELLKYSKTLNDKLHTLKVAESNRSLLISGALIALTDKAFCKAYKYQKPKELAENLINTIKNKLTDKFFNEVMAEIGPDRWDERVHVGKANKPETQTKYTDTISSVCSGYLVEDCCDASRFNWNNVDYDFYLAEIEKIVIRENK